MLEGSILKQLEMAHRQGTRPLRFGVYYKNTLVSLCHALEDQILSAEEQPLVITAFQQGKWYLQEADRYREIAQKSQQVVIMAAPDAGFTEHPTSQLPNVDVVGLDTADPVSQEWHLIILSDHYSAMVLCQELAPEDYGKAGRPESDLERKFYGLWTFEPDLVRETAEIAIAHLQPYNPALAEKLRSCAQTYQPTIASRGDLSSVVERVVDYLQQGQAELALPNYHARYQALDRNLVSNEVQAFLRMAQLMDIADLANPNAAAEVLAISEMMGQLLDLPAWQIKRLRLAALLHRIEPLQSTPTVFAPGTSRRLEENAPSCPLTCPLVPGAQVLRTMPQLRAVAQIVTHQREWWNGEGEPAGLAGDEIPLESRILALVTEFQWWLSRFKESASQEKYHQALAACQQQQGDRFDPKLVETLSLLVMGLQQGLPLPQSTLKFSAGLWLLDSHLTTSNKALQYEF